MGFGQFVSIIKARWVIVLSLWLLTVGITLGVSLILPPQYRAAAAVVVESRPDPISALVYPTGVAPAAMATQLDVIQSDRVAQRVVTNLKLGQNPKVRQQWLEDTGGKGTIEAWLAGAFSRQLDVKPSRDSNVINISYAAPDPQFAATVANAFVQAYMDTVLDLRVNPAKQYSSFFDAQAKEAREALEQAQTKLSAFQREKGIIAADERFDVENSRLSELSSQLVMLQTLAAESSSRQFQAQGGGADKMQEVLNNPVIAGLKADLSRAEAKLQELSARLGDNHPQVREAQANIAGLRSKIEAETRRVSGGVGVTNSINHAREAQIRADLEAQRSKVLHMKAVRDEGSVLVREVENAQRRYDAVLARLNQSSLESQSTQANISVLSPAAPPLEPASPRVVLNTLLAIVLGAILAIAAALGIEMIDRRVRDVADLDQALGLPVLGTMPKPTVRGLLGRQRIPLMQQRLLAQLPANGKGA
jgi:chain length determinant protein EpsF